MQRRKPEITHAAPAFHRLDNTASTCEDIHSALQSLCCPIPHVPGLFVQHTAVNVRQHLMSKCWHLLFIKLIYFLVLPATKSKALSKRSFARKLQNKPPPRTQYGSLFCIKSLKTKQLTPILHYVYFVLLVSRTIQGVPGGMDKTSGECSLC